MLNYRLSLDGCDGRCGLAPEPNSCAALSKVRLGDWSHTKITDTNEINPDLRCVVWRGLAVGALGGGFLIERDGKPKNQDHERTGHSSPV